jgi:Transglycosylase SLT domain
VHRERSPRAFRANQQQNQLVGFIVNVSAHRVRATPSPGSDQAVALGALSVSGYLGLYQAAAATCPGLPWEVVAAIGTVESSNGQSTAPGVHSGANSKGAEGPMQMLPASFARYALPVPPGGATPPNPYDPVDAVYAAVRYLCADGGRGGRDLAGAVFAYNHANWYVTEVLTIAARYAGKGA